MRNSNANNTILFIEKKKEFENNRDNHNSKDNKIVIKDKNAKIISLSTYKRLKFKRHHIINKGEKHLNIDKVKKRVFLIVILALFLLIFATTVMRQRSYSSVPSNTFIAQNTKINTTESLTYKWIHTKYNRYFRINIANASLKDIKEGIDIISDNIDIFLANYKEQNNLRSNKIFY